MTITPTNPYASNISLTCCTNLPTGAKGTFSVSSVTLSGVSPVSSQLNITTTARPVNTVPTASLKRLRQFYAFWMLLLEWPWSGLAGSQGGGRRVLRLCWPAVSFWITLLKPACGGTTTPTPVSGTPTRTIRWWRQRPQGATPRTLLSTPTVP